METDRIFIREIEPAVLELEEAVKSRPYLQALVGRYFSSRKDFIAAATVVPVLSLVAADYQAFFLITGAAFGGVNTAALLSDTYNEMRKTHRPEQNHLFFYYRAGQLLKS